MKIKEAVIVEGTYDKIKLSGAVEANIVTTDGFDIIHNEEKVGGIVLRIDGSHGELELLFTSPKKHSKGIGYAAWCEVEKMYPQVRIWETVTPYFETRNIHFYVNRCGFHIVEFFNRYHPDPNEMDDEEYEEGEDDGMFRFEKVMY